MYLYKIGKSEGILYCDKLMDDPNSVACGIENALHRYVENWQVDKTIKAPRRFRIFGKDGVFSV